LESTTASSALVSLDVKPVPAVILAALSAPSEVLDTSTPSTVNEFVVKFDEMLPLPDLTAGTVPVTVTSFRVSPPTALLTLCSPATVPTELALSVPYWVLTRLLMLIFVPAAICPRRNAWICWRNPNVVARLAPATGGWVTVMSVPTP
jgi:hypothetical protein